MLLLIGILFMIFFYAVAGILLVGIISGFIFTLVDLWSFLLILLPLLFFLIVSKSGKLICEYIKTSFMKNYIYTKNELQGLSKAIKNIIKFVLAVGGFNFVLFIINALANLGAPEYLGPYLAISLTSLTYSVAISFFVFFPVKAWAENKINTLII